MTLSRGNSINFEEGCCNLSVDKCKDKSTMFPIIFDDTVEREGGGLSSSDAAVEHLTAFIFTYLTTIGWFFVSRANKNNQILPSLDCQPV